MHLVSPSSLKKFGFGVLLTLMTTLVAHANTTAYITGSSGIYSWDTSGTTVNLLPNSPTGLDSLIFDTHGNIIYSQISSNAVGIYNLSTNTNTVLNPNAGPGVADMAPDPSGDSFLVSDAFGTTIQRVSLSTGAILNTFNVKTRPDGLAYDNSGNLFAVLGLNSISQLDPLTGAILNSISAPSGCGTADALTFDSGTGSLYMSCDSGGFATVNTSLTSATFTSLNFSPDGIASKGNTLYFVGRGCCGIVYDLTTNTSTNISDGIGGADDIAPLSGLGSQPTPEPSSLLLLGAGLCGLASLIRKKAQK